jgi:hypothetical protein
VSSTTTLTRRQLLGRAAAGGVVIAGGAVAADQLALGGGGRGGRRLLGSAHPSVIHSDDGFVAGYRSRPDLRLPAATLRGTPRPGCLLLGPGTTKGVVHAPPPTAPQQGSLIVGGDGEPVWFDPRPGAAWSTNLRMQRFRGQPVLTSWEGTVIDPGFGQGEGVIRDRSYRVLARVRAGNGRLADLHEFRLTDRGTALITCYPETVPADLTAVGGPTDGSVIDSVFQEVDIATGQVLLEWRGLDHIAVAESHQPYNEPYDYLHLNSIDVLPDGHLLVSARATWALYKLDRRTGAVIWRLGGTASDFALGPGARFSWQHDAAPVADGRITVFDDAAGPVQSGPHSRGIVLAVDETRRTATLDRAYVHPNPVLATAMGSVQALPDGHVLVGWGTSHYTTEFAPGGRVVADLSMRDPNQLSYRAYHADWRAVPEERPALAAHRGEGRRPTMLYASWNGDTEAHGWRVRGGTTSRRLQLLGDVPRRGFETAIPVHVADGWFNVAPLDAHGRELAVSPVRQARRHR